MELKKEIDRLAIKFYPLIDVCTIGTSRMGRRLYALIVGSGDKHVMINASHHANEWITSVIALNFLEELLTEMQKSPRGKKVTDFINNTTLHVIPMVNPDGVDLVTGGLGRLRPVYRRALQMVEAEQQHSYTDSAKQEVVEDITSINGFFDVRFAEQGIFAVAPFSSCKQNPFSGWKANAIGVDLNSNYPAGWEQAREHKFARGYTAPSSRDYVGEYPLSEPETSAMVAYTKANDFVHTISLHTQGEEIFWRYQNYNPPGATELAHRLAAVSGYALVDVPDTSAHGGYRDWFIQEYNRPGMTIECGKGENPLPLSDFDKIYKKVAPLLWEAV